MALPSGKRVLSGVKPSGALHLGNYFAAIRQHIALQDGNDGRYFIADYHSMTTVFDADERRRYALDIALDYLALGLDPERAILYRQSDLPEVCELTWALASVTAMGLLERAHAYKDAIAKDLPIETGLFAYPLLMAADILIHEADLVPVGQDQKQHLEMTRDMAQRFNNRYGDVLKLPEPYILADVATIPGTDGRKMSKSYGNTIEMFASQKALRRQVMGIVTDSTPVCEPKDPELALYQLWNLFASGDEREELRERCLRGGQGYGDVKKDLLSRVMDHFGSARKRREELAARPDTLEEVLSDGARRSRESTGPLVEAVRRVAGLGRPS